MHPMGWITVGLGGWLWGSFLNQLVDRLASPPGPLSNGRGGGSYVTLLHPPRSVCLCCGATIRWFDNIPILSFLLLRGRCRSCGASIGLRTLLVECATPLITLVIYGAMGLGWLTGTVWAGASWMIVAVPMRRERRRVPWWFWVLGGAIGLLCLTAFAWGTRS